MILADVTLRRPQASTAERLAHRQPNRRQDGREEVSMSEATEVAAADP